MLGGGGGGGGGRGGGQSTSGNAHNGTHTTEMTSPTFTS